MSTPQHPTLPYMKKKDKEICDLNIAGWSANTGYQKAIKAFSYKFLSQFCYLATLWKFHAKHLNA